MQVLSYYPIIPIPKNCRKSLSDSNNYRGIALNSCLGKVMECVLLKCHRDQMATSDLQFGFKPKTSTTRCTFVLDEIIDYYHQNDSNVYSLLLDASKAFDCVNHIKLLRKLIDRDICPMAAKLILMMHVKQEIRVKWDKHLSDTFQAKNGVKQGGILSPILFCLYTEELLIELKSSGVGCHIGQTFVGAIGYADDISLQSPTISGLNIMLKVAQSFSETHFIKFNSSKFQLVIHECKKSRIDKNIVLNFDGNAITPQHNAVHLGHIIGGQDCQEQRVMAAIGDLYKRTNLLMSRFSFCSTFIRYKLFNTHCMSLYGSNLWDITSKHFEMFNTAWRKCVRRVLGLHPMTHRVLIPMICNDFNADDKITMRFCNFIRKAGDSPNEIVRLCIQLALAGSLSSSGSNITALSWRHNIPRHKFLSQTPILSKVEPSLLSNQIRDFIHLRDNTKDPYINDILMFLTTT